MAARNFTGSARVRAAGSKSGAIKISANLADAEARMGDIRAGITAPVEWLYGQNVGVDADVSSTLPLLESAFPLAFSGSNHARRTGSVAFDPLIRAPLTGAP